MRLSNTQAVARPVPIDRNPTNISRSGSTNAAAPHATTIRWSYTVPVNRKAVVQAGRTYSQRNTAATTVGPATTAIRYQPNGGSLFVMFAVNLVTNGVNDLQDGAIPGMGDMLAGDYVDGIDVDNSTGGTTSQASAAKIFEYDA